MAEKDFTWTHRGSSYRWFSCGGSENYVSAIFQRLLTVGATFPDLQLAKFSVGNIWCINFKKKNPNLCGCNWRQKQFEFLEIESYFYLISDRCSLQNGAEDFDYFTELWMPRLYYFTKQYFCQDGAASSQIIILQKHEFSLISDRHNNRNIMNVTLIMYLGIEPRNCFGNSLYP